MSNEKQEKPAVANLAPNPPPAPPANAASAPASKKPNKGGKGAANEAPAAAPPTPKPKPTPGESPPQSKDHMNELVNSYSSMIDRAWEAEKEIIGKLANKAWDKIKDIPEVKAMTDFVDKTKGAMEARKEAFFGGIKDALNEAVDAIEQTDIVQNAKKQIAKDRENFIKELESFGDKVAAAIAPTPAPAASSAPAPAQANEPQAKQEQSITMSPVTNTATQAGSAEQVLPDADGLNKQTSPEQKPEPTQEPTPEPGATPSPS